MRELEEFDGDSQVGFLVASLPDAIVVAAEIGFVLFVGIFFKGLFVLLFHDLQSLL